jgi:fumarate hydratase class II
VTFLEFIKTIRADVDAFEQFWAMGRAHNKDAFPMKMGASDWFEQFLTFAEGREPD